MVLGTALVIVAGVVYAAHRHHDGGEVALDAPSATASTVPTSAATRSRTPAASAPSGASSALLQSLGAAAGLSGSGRTDATEHHRLVATVTGQDPLGKIGYYIPTDQADPGGTPVVRATSWRKTATVWGRPKYAIVSAQANYTGHPVTCTITVDGRVTERRTTKGPFSVIWCVG